MSSLSPRKSVLLPTGTAARTITGISPLEFRLRCPGSGLFNAGYSIGNDSWANSNATKNRYVFVYYGVTF